MKKITKEEGQDMLHHELLAHVLKLQEELETRGQGVWIPVTERLPEAMHEDVSVMTFPHYRILHFEDGRWETFDSASDTVVSARGVTHWQPLPPPPGTERTTRPLPPKVPRARTDEELLDEIFKGTSVFGNRIDRALAKAWSTDTIIEICTAAGISLTVLEEV